MESVGEYEYHTKDLIGQGAFAMVYKGRNKKVSGIERLPKYSTLDSTDFVAAESSLNRRS